ncbi:hypothetical protein ACFLSJ_02475 [Verrucomicrobiota bacterium]
MVATRRMPRLLIALIAVTAARIAVGMPTGTPETRTHPTVDAFRSRSARIAVPFIANKGQITHEDVLFYAKTFSGTVSVMADGSIVYSIPKREARMAPPTPDARLQTGELSLTALGVFRERLLGASRAAPRGKGEAATKVSYFIGGADRWRSTIPCYETVDLGEVYPGINLTLKAHGRNVEKVFTVAPGADPSLIKLRLDGADCILVDPGGELVLKSELGNVHFTAPVAYQETHGRRDPVQVAYSTQGNAYGFAVGDYDPDIPLTIDPLLASTYFGGTDSDIVTAIATGSGHIYVAGRTESDDLPITPGAYQTAIVGREEILVAKFDANLSTLLASTYIGGAYDDEAYDMAVDGGHVYVVGSPSSGFPTTPGAFTNEWPGQIFVLKLDANLSTLLSSSCFGSNPGAYSSDEAVTIDVSGGNVYIAGITYGYITIQGYMNDFPTTHGAYDETYNGGFNDFFVCKLDGNLTGILSATYLGGTAAETYVLSRDVRITVGGGHVYVAGHTTCRNFPTTPGAYDTDHNGNRDIFVSKFDANLSTLLDSTYLGDTQDENACAVYVDGSSVFVGGYTSSTNFPTTAGAYDRTYAGSSDGILARFSGNLSTLYDSTFLGGSGKDTIYGLVVESGYVYVSGDTRSSNFPATAAGDGTYSGSGDGFVSKLDLNLSALLSSTYLGGTGFESARDMLTHGGNVYVAGYTASTDYPVTAGSFDPTSNGMSDGFITKLDANLTGPPDRSGLWINAADVGEGWRWLPWFGYFNVITDPWIYHQQHGWMYAVGTTTASIWFYADDMGWLWSTHGSYPYMYRSQDQAWLWYLKDTAHPRWFLNLTTGQWEQH